MTKKKARIEQAPILLEESDEAVPIESEPATDTVTDSVPDLVTVKFTGVRAVLGLRLILHNETRTVTRQAYERAEKAHPGEWEISQ